MRWLLFCLTWIFSSCYRDRWHHISIPNGETCYDVAKLIHTPYSFNEGIELELTRIGKEVYGYINVHAFQFPSSKEDPDTTLLMIITSNTTKSFMIPLMQGKQRARLTEACLEYLLQALQLKISVTLECGYFSEILDVSYFQRHYHALMRKSNQIHPSSILSFEL